MWKYASLVLKNLTRNKRRLALTILSIAVSLFVFSALVSLPAVANAILASSASSERLVCLNKAGLAYGLPESYAQKIALAPHVTAVVAQSWFGGIYHDPTDQFPNFAIDPEHAELIWPDYFTPDGIAQFKRLRTAALVGPSTMKRFGWHVGQQIMLKGTIYAVNPTFTIVGELTSKAPPDFFMFRRDYLEELLGRPGFVGLFYVRADTSSSEPLITAELDETFANSSAETQTESETAFFGSFLENYRLIFRMASILGLIVVVSIGLVAANTAAMSIRERRGEIAVMRSMGFSTRIILGLLLGESIIIGMVGGLLGCGSAYLLLKVMSVSGAGLMPGGIAIRIPPVVLVQSLILAAVIGLLSGFFPARAAARRNIVDALRMVA
jgi:putative ABC transport system permease protein